MINPLQFVDDQGIPHIEPSVTATMSIQTQESPPPELLSDLYVLGTFRDPPPDTLIRVSSIAEAISAFDADQTNDEGVALIKKTKDGIADPNMFGAGDVIGCRVNQATPSTSTISAAALYLLSLATAKCGNQTRRWRRQLTVGTLAGSKKIRLWNDYNKFVIDNLGPVFSLQYVGDGASATLTILRSGGIIAYSVDFVPTSGTSTFVVNGTTFEFNNGAPAGGHIAVAIGDTPAACWANALAAISANIPGVTGVQDTTARTITLSAPEDGIVLTGFPCIGSSGSATGAASGTAAALETAVAGANDGSASLMIPLTTAYSSIANLVGYLNQQVGYAAAVLTGPTAYVNNGFLMSSALDIVAAVNIKGAVVNLTAYTAAIADAVNSQTKGLITCTVLAQGEPDEDAGAVQFTGGVTPLPLSSDWETALDLIGSQVQAGGILLLDTDDPAIFAMAQVWKADQKTLGKWFRVYCGAQPGLTASQYAQIVAGLNDSDVRLVVQRMQDIDPVSGAIIDFDPVYLAAALAGASAGNKPYKNPQTNKQLRFVGISPDDDFDLPTRQALESSGITIAKTEQASAPGLGNVAVPLIVLSVSTSLSDKRMARIVAETDTVNLISFTVRQAFLAYRGKWANDELIRRAPGTLLAILDQFRKDGAIVPGFDQSRNPIPAYLLGTPAATIYMGVLKLSYAIYIGGEVDHVALRGDAEYTQLVASLTGTGQISLTTSINL